MKKSTGAAAKKKNKSAPAKTGSNKPAVKSSLVAAKKKIEAAPKSAKVSKTVEAAAALAAPQAAATAAVAPNAIPCNICGSVSFKAGPKGRLSTSGMLPLCVDCGSAERHRAFRTIFENIRASGSFKQWNCVSFSKDRSFAGGWFASVRQADLEGTQGTDLKHAELADESSDVAVCNGTLAMVPQFERSLKEIARVLSKKGFAFISFPNPHYRKETQEWGAAKKENGGLYRTFGEDVETRLPGILPALGIVRVVSEDPVTGHEDRAYIISKNSDFLARLGERGLRIRFLQF